MHSPAANVDLLTAGTRQQVVRVHFHVHVRVRVEDYCLQTARTLSKSEVHTSAGPFSAVSYRRKKPNALYK